MYWLGVLILVILLVLVFSFSGSILVLIDVPSIILIITIVIPLLLASGQFKPFLLAVKIAAGKVKKSPSTEVKKAIVAVNLTIKLLLLAGLIGFLSGLILILATLDVPSKIGPNAAVSILTNLYALFMIVFLLPVKAKLEAFLIDQECQ